MLAWKYARFWASVVHFDNHDWEDEWKKTRDVVSYITHYSTNSVNDILEWDQWLLLEIYDGVGAIIEQENKAGTPSF